MELLIKAIAVGYILWSAHNFVTPTSFKNGLKQMWNCNKCLSFWIILISSGGNFTLAAMVSLTILILESFIVTKL